MVIVYAIIMSSWKQYGGKNTFDKAGQIDAYSITVNKLRLKEIYQGTFDICGQLIVRGNTLIDGSLTVKEGMDISGNVVIGEPGSVLTVNSDSIFNGSLQINSAFIALGNIVSNEDVIAERDVIVGRFLDFSGGSFLYSVGNTLGINTVSPTAALDISTNSMNGIIVSSSNTKNDNILAQNAGHKGITLGVDSDSAYILFNHDKPIPALPDGGIYYTPGGYLNIDVSKNVNISCPMTVSLGDKTEHVMGEEFTVYDISQGVYFGNIYQNDSAYTGVAAAFIADSSFSNVSTFIGAPTGLGLSIGGGAYPSDVTKGMATIGLTDTSGVYTPAQVIVSGNLTSHSLTTTGINTFQPRVDSYVLDVNGPIHVDNGDIASIDTLPAFEVYSISVSPDDRNIAVGLGSSIEVINDIPIGPNPPLPKEKLVVSYNGGISWDYIDVSNSAGIFSGNTVLKGNVLNNIHLYDSTNWFITGEKNMIANSYDGGVSWQNISVSGLANGLNYKNVFINPEGDLVFGNVFGYFSADASFVLFQIPIDGPFITTVESKIVDSQLSSISAVKANSSAIYIAGNAIAKFSASNSVINQTPTLQSIHSFNESYSYNDLQIFDNSYVIAVGQNIISSTTNGGLTWQDVVFDSEYGGQGVQFTGVHMADISNAIAVGSQGNIWITTNKGISWSPIPLNLINSSGESKRLLNTNNQFRNVVMTDDNTILITNTLQSYNYFTNTYGKSSVFTVYSPNFINRANNMVLDISGGVRISGDMFIDDGGSLGSNNATFSLLNSGVESVYLGGEATSIVMGADSGTTEIRNNVLLSSNSDSTSSDNGALVVSGGAGIVGNVNIGGILNVLLDSSMNGNVLMTSRTSSTSSTSGSLVVSGGVGIVGNLNIGGVSNFVSDASFNGNVLFTSTTPSTNSTSGALVVSGGVGIGGNLNVNGNTSFQSHVLFQTDASFNENVVVVKDVVAGNIVSRTNNFHIKSATSGGTIYTIANPGNQDVVTINGVVTIPNLQSGGSLTPFADGPAFLVNAVTTRGNAISGGCGYDIFDNSNVGQNPGKFPLVPPSPNDSFTERGVFAFMHVGQDLQSFVFKAPSYGRIGGANSDILAPLTLISPENRLRIAVNQLTFGASSPPGRRGLVILQSNSDFVNYQTGLGQNYPNAAIDSDYVMNLCPDFDISNILLKAVDTVVGTQSIATNLNIGNILVPYNLTVFGNSVVNGNLLLNGNVGIGTTNPLVTLDVSGLSRFVGPLVSTNYDTLRFSSNYGRGLSNIQNQAPAGDYYQDAAISYDGQFQYGLLYDRTGVGAVNVSSNYGSTWSTTVLPLNYSGNIIDQAVPFMNGNVVTFPFTSLEGNIAFGSVGALNIQAGTYEASGSSFGVGADYFNVFDNSTSTSWNPLNSQYDNTGVYTGPYSTLNSGNGVSIGGEYVQISLPYSFIITNYRIFDNNNRDRFPKSTYLFGSNNGSSWFSLVPGGTTITANITTTVNINNNTPYNYYRFVVNSINNTSGTSSPLINLINLSGIFQNVTGSFSSAMAASGTGQYVTVANQGYYAGQGNLITSSNYGSSFTDTGVRDTVAVWQSVAMSQTGNIQVAVSQNRRGFGNIFISYNSGSSWSNVAAQIIRNGWQTVSISSNGQYITAIAATFASNTRGNILVSSNYGASFSQPTGLPQIYNYIEPANGFLNLGMSDFNKTVCVSSSGQYQTALGLGLSSRNDGTASIWVSSNYGANWRDTRVRAPFENGLVSVFTSITMNGSGQNQIATYMTGNIITGLRSQVSGNALVSSDYGNTWININYTIPSVSSSGNVYYGGVTKVQSSLNGQYVFGVSKYQDICGNTYTNTTSSAFGVGNVYLSSVPVTSGLLLTQYFGSAHTGNVFQSHGLELSVPNANNAAVFAGYDVNWDAGYINSADQNASKSLGLNTTGGFVGVGKITPSATLDVLGNSLISGDMIIGGRTTLTSTSGSISTTTGALTVAGGAGIGGNLFTGGNIIINSTAGSTSTTTGALIVAGGAGIGGNLNVGGFSTYAFDSSFNGNIQLTQTNNPLWLISRNASTINSTLSNNASDVGIFYGSTNPAAAGLVISPRGIGGGIKMATNGNVSIGTTSNAFTLDVAGTIRATGQITGLSFNATSDYRTKRNVEPIPSNFTINELRPVHYDISNGEGHDMGFIAHEVQEVFPFLVSGEKDGELTQSLNYNGIIALLVKEVQDLKKENLELKVRMCRLEKYFM